VTGFLIRFFSGSGSVPVFWVDRFNNRSGSGNFDPYSTASNSRKFTQPQNKNSSLGFVPYFFWKTCLPLSSLKLTQKYLMLLLSMCLAHYPMHSFINMKMTFSLQSVFSPSPTLNPKAKIRSCLFQDQGS
jgi:hypothetical protein